MGRMLATGPCDHSALSGDFTGWHRVGRGRSLQFYATDEEIAEWLIETLPAEFGPYVGFREEWAHPSLIVHESRIEEIGRSFSEGRSARHWIKSDRLSPGLKAHDVSVPDDLGTVSFSGLISIRLGEDRNGRREGAALAMIDRIRHEQTGEERRQSDYLRIFERLRRSMRKRLVVPTDDWPMTARAAAAHARREVTFAASPLEREDARL